MFPCTGTQNLHPANQRYKREYSPPTTVPVHIGTSVIVIPYVTIAHHLDLYVLTSFLKAQLCLLGMKDALGCVEGHHMVGDFA